MFHAYIVPRSGPLATSSDGLRLVTMGLALWMGVFLLFTFRSLFLGLPYIGEQAGLRCIMMVIGAGLCGLICLAANCVVGLRPSARAAILAIAVLLAGVVYSSANYTLLYVVAADWPDYTPAVPLIVSYFTSTVWIFALWLCLLFLSKNRARGAHPSTETTATAQEPTLSLKHHGAMIRIRLQEIQWAQSEGDYVRLHVHGRSYLHRMTLEDAERLLSNVGFVRVHRRFVIPLVRIERFGRDTAGRRIAYLIGGVTVPIGRAYAARLRQLIAIRAQSA